MDRLTCRFPQIGHERKCHVAYRTPSRCALSPLEHLQPQTDLLGSALQEARLLHLLDQSGHRRFRELGPAGDFVDAQEDVSGTEGVQDRRKSADHRCRRIVLQQ
jgi:hypothetical protein